MTKRHGMSRVVLRFFVVMLLVLVAAVANYAISLSRESSTRQSGDRRVKIGVIDSGLTLTNEVLPYLCKDGHKSFVPGEPWWTDSDLPHGTNIVSILKDYMVPKLHCVVVVRYWTSRMSGSESREAMLNSITYLQTVDVSYVNISSSGFKFSLRESKALRELVSSGVRVSVSAGNLGRNLGQTCTVYPACYHPLLDPDKFHVVGANDLPWSNYGGVVWYYESGRRKGTPYMSGTSQATAVHTGRWLRGEVL